MPKNKDPVPRPDTVPVRLRLAGQVLRAADADPAAPPDGPLSYRLGLEEWYWYARDPAARGVTGEGVRHILVLPDGRELASGVSGQAAIRRFTLTEAVNDANELMPGAACAACIEAELWAPPGPDGRPTVPITAGQELVCYREWSGRREPLGLFTAEQPARASANTFRLVAYDRMARTDKDLSSWLRASQGQFPMTLGALVRAVCAQCGVALADGDLPNAGLPVPAFYADGLTGRQLLQWAGQAMGRFCRARPDGRLEFAWYAPAPPGRLAAPGGAARPVRLRLAGQVLRTADADPAPPDGPFIYRLGIEPWWYYAGGLAYETYTAAPVEAVRIRQTDNDTGVLWPPDAPAGANTLVLGGNLLLAGCETPDLRTVARALYEQLRGFVYSPGTLRLPEQSGLRAGMLVPVEDAAGRRLLLPVMQCVLEDGVAVLTADGSPRRDSSTAAAGAQARNRAGRLLELETSVDGLRVRAGDLTGAVTELGLDVGGLRTEVRDQNGRLSTLDQTVGGFTLTASDPGDGKTARLELRSGEMLFSGAELNFAGLVSFSDLSTAGQTTISGANITTGVIRSRDGRNVIDLDTGEATFTGTVHATDGEFSGTVYANRIAVGGDYGYITGAQVGSHTLGGGNIAQGTVSGWNIGGGTITGSNIGGDTVARGNLVEKYALTAQYNSLYADVANLKTLVTDFTGAGSISVHTLSADQFILGGHKVVWTVLKSGETALVMG